MYVRLMTPYNWYLLTLYSDFLTEFVQSSDDKYLAEGGALQFCDCDTTGVRGTVGSLSVELVGILRVDTPVKETDNCEESLITLTGVQWMSRDSMDDVHWERCTDAEPPVASVFTYGSSDTLSAYKQQFSVKRVLNVMVDEQLQGVLFCVECVWVLGGAQCQ
ncbi:hypothetical protein Tco_1107184 [Tanacetum coccineum]